MRGRGVLLAGLAALLCAPATAGAVGGKPPAYLPEAFCLPVDRDTDDAANAFQPPDSHLVKLVYAHPSDAPSRFESVSTTISDGVRSIVEYLYLESGERKSLRVDLGTSEGPDCVDVQHVSLPRPASAYIPPDTGTTTTQPLEDDLRPRLGSQPGVRLYLVIVEIENRRAGGLANLVDDDSPGGAAHATGDRIAYVFNPAGPSDFNPRYVAQNGLHEVFHLLGAVQSSAPHAGGNGHCVDFQLDLMCTGGDSSCQLRQYTTTELPLPLDCNGDDYFNPEPPAGSYLATHWNTYNSPFLCPVGTCAPDNFAPKTKVKGPKRTDDPTPKFKLRADEPVSGFRCSLDTGKFRRCDSPYKAPKLDDGKHRLRVFAIDEAGNEDESPDTHRFRVVD
jgi:hypothetical protein